MIYEIYYEADNELRVTLFDIEIYNEPFAGGFITNIIASPAVGNLLTFFHKKSSETGFDLESFIRDTDYVAMLKSNLWSLIDSRAPFQTILDRLERIINRYAEKYGFYVKVD